MSCYLGDLECLTFRMPDQVSPFGCPTPPQSEPVQDEEPGRTFQEDYDVLVMKGLNAWA